MYVYIYIYIYMYVYVYVYVYIYIYIYIYTCPPEVLSRRKELGEVLAWNLVVPPPARVRRARAPEPRAEIK